MKTLHLMSICMVCAGYGLAQDIIAPWGDHEPGPVQRAATQPHTPELNVEILRPSISLHPTRHTFGLNIGYGIKALTNGNFTCNIVDFELEYGYHLHPQHAITASFDFGIGSRKSNSWYLSENKPPRPFSDNFDRTMCGLMLGYRFSQIISNRCQLQMGIKGGLDMQRLRADIGRDWSLEEAFDQYYDEDNETWVTRHRRFGHGNSAYGFSYAAYISYEWLMTENITLSFGYLYRGTTARPHGYPEFPKNSERITASAADWHELRLGISSRF